MPNTLVTQLLYLLDEAFDGPDWESFLGNLKPVTPADWLWVAPRGRRSIRDIVAHVGGCKYMYHNQAFGDARFTWNDPLVSGVGALGDIQSAVAWLQEGHKRLHHSIAALEDDDLLCLRPHHSGKPKETRLIISTLLEHDIYHAGEINYIRALHQQNDE